MADWGSIKQVFDLCFPIIIFIAGFSGCLAIFLRIFITKFALDVRDLTPRLQALVMLDNILLRMLGAEIDTSYSRSITTGLSLEELKDLDDAELEARRPEIEAKLAKDARSHYQAVSIMKAFVIAGMSLIGGFILVLFVTSLF